MHQNRILLAGMLAEPITFSHESHGQKYNVLLLAVKRLSGVFDRIRVLARDDLCAGLAQDDFLTVEGTVRSFNNKSGRGNRLIVAVLAREISRGDGEYENKAELSGSLCKPPIYRKTPLGREICDMILAVNRPFGRADYLPCIAWGNDARRCGEALVGTMLALEGRIQSREYIKITGEEQNVKTAYELSVSQLQILPRGEGGEPAQGL